MRPAHDAIVELLGRGVTQKQIAEVAGVSKHTIRQYLRDPDRMTSRGDTVDAVAGVLDPMFASRFDRPSLVGAQRRLRALLRMGHSHATMRERLGFNPLNVTVVGRRTTWSWEEHERVVALYDELSMKVGEPLVIAKARSLGYPPPLAWDDDTIDDPRARPAGLPEEVHGVLPVGREFRSLMKRRTPEQVARIYGVSPKTVRRLMKENGLTPCA